jgi:hypothetical protein
MVFTSSLAVVAAASVLLLASPVPRPSLRIGVTFSVAEGVAFKARGAVFTAIADEADAIWRPHGVLVRAVSLLDPVPPQAVDVRVAVQLVDRFDRRAAANSPGLGAIVFQGRDGFEPAIKIAVESVETMLSDRKINGRPIAEWPAGLAGTVRSRALGRVLAHELGHYLVGLPAHRSGGLMRTVFDGRALASPDRADFRLDAIDLPRLRARVSQLAQGATVARLAQSPD